jgi:benzylsuccinate CoA-transferase BbsF subunit
VASTFIGEVLLDYAMNGNIQNRKGNRDEFMAPHNLYRCKGVDRWISIAIASDTEWQTLVNVMGSPDWAMEQRYASVDGRWEYQDEIDAMIRQWTQQFEPFELANRLQTSGIAAFPCYNAKDILADEHLKQRGTIVEIKHPVHGKRLAVGPPWKFSKTAARFDQWSTELGEHNQYVFHNLLGYGMEEIDEMIEKKIVY